MAGSEWLDLKESARVDHPEEPIAVLSLCTGGDGLDAGFALAVPGARHVVRVEHEAFAVAELVRRMEAGELHPSAIWTDLRTFDGRPFAGIADVILGGYPCQPFSTAGRRGGESDPRHLWPHVARVVAEVRPPIVFFENVSGHLSLGFDQVAADLEAMGFEVAAGLFTAAEVGASHKRERLFILGVMEGATGNRGSGQFEQAGRARPETRSGTMADGPGQRRRLLGGSDGSPEGASSGEARSGAVRGGDGSSVDEQPEPRDSTLVHTEYGQAGHGGRGEESGPASHVRGRMCGPTDAGGILADSGCRSDQPGRDSGIVPDAACEAEGDSSERERCRDSSGDGVADVDNLPGQRRGQRRTGAEFRSGRDSAGGTSCSVGLADSREPRPQGRTEGGVLRGQFAYGGLPLFPPGPGDRYAWASILEAHPEYAPATQPGVCGVVDGLADVRAAWLRILGNGVCPLQAAMALCTLWTALVNRRA